MKGISNLIEQYLKVLDNPHIVHAIVGHLPVAFALFGLLLVLVGAVSRMKNATVRGMALTVFALAALSAYGADITGLVADTALADESLGGALRETHQWWATYAWIPAAVTVLFILFCFMKSEGTKTMFTLLALIAALGTVGFVGMTAITGTQLVYEQGVGVEMSVDEAPSDDETESQPQPAAPAAPPTGPSVQPEIPPLPPAEVVSEDL